MVFADPYMTTTHQDEVQEPLGQPFNVHLQGVALANLADGIILGALPLIAVSLTRSPGEIALVQTAFWLPWLLFGVLAGIAVDRFDRRHVQLVGSAIRVGMMAIMAFLAFTDRLTMPVLIGVSGLYGVTQVFIDLAGSSIVPQLAPRSRLSAANGRVMGAQQVFTNFLGGPLGGAILVLGSGWVFGIPAAVGVIFLFVVGLRLRGDYHAERSHKPDSGRVQEMLEGIRFQLHHPVLRPLLINGSILNFANTAYFAVFILWMVGPDSRVRLEPHQFPILLAIIALGAVVGSLFAERLLVWIPEVPLILGIGLLNSMLLAVPVVWPVVAPIGAAFFIIGFSNIVGNIVRRSMSQRLIPGNKLGKVGGASGMINYGLMPVGALVGGLIGEAWGLPTVFLGAVVLMLISGVWVCTRVSTGLVRENDLALAGAGD